MADSITEPIPEVSSVDTFDDYDGHRDTPHEAQVPITINDDVPIKETITITAQHSNELDTNNDFIAFSSGSEDEADDNVANEKENEEITSGPILNTDFPWIIDHDHSKESEIADWLNMEIRDFVSYISPNRVEIEARNKTMDKLKSAVQELWPGADLQVFGSYATDMYLPGSDLDCVINTKEGNKNDRSHLYALAKFLKQRNLATQVEVVAKTRVPIIKFVEPQSKIHIDVSFERTNGVEAAKLIRSWLDQTPGLREIVLVVKQFLHARLLNNVRTGGLGGFSIICLVYAFLHMHPRIITNEIDVMDNLGVLLIEFFELYGKNFGYDHIGIAVDKNQPSYFNKHDWTDMQQIPTRSKTTFTLAIKDPGDSTNNISRGSFNMGAIKRAFAGGFDLLTNRCFEMHSIPFKQRRGKSVLGNVIKYRGVARDFHDERALVKNKAIEENEKFYRKRGRIVHEREEGEENEEISKKRKLSNRDESEEDDYNPLG